MSLVEFVKTVLAQERVRIIGVCFGHQIVGRALGLPVGRSDAGWEVSVVTVELTDVGKQILKLEGLVSLTLQMLALLLTKDTESLSDAPRHR